MAVYIVDHLSSEEYCEVYGVQRHDHEQDREDACLHYSFERMKGEGCPGRRIGGLVMYEVKYLEELWMMHETVHPIEVGIVDNESDRECQPEP